MYVVFLKNYLKHLQKKLYFQGINHNDAKAKILLLYQDQNNVVA
jgi:hypothetical protein